MFFTIDVRIIFCYNLPYKIYEWRTRFLIFPDNTDETINDSSNKTTTSILRSALKDIMEDGKPRTTDIMQTDLASKNIVYGVNYNVNHLWGAINTLKKSGIIKKVGRGEYQLCCSANKIKDVLPVSVSSSLPSNLLISQIELTLKNDINTALLHMSKASEEFNVLNMPFSDVHRLYELSKIKDALEKLLSDLNASTP
jgi:hypothetical protein